MPRIVIDASVVLKWIPGKNEEKVDEAREIYKMMKDGHLEVYTPTFLLIEVLNILANKRKTDPKVIKNIINELVKGKINFFESTIEDIYKIEDYVLNNKLTSYDAYYLHLASKNKCKLLTFDKHLLKFHDLTIDIDRLLKLMKSN